MIKQNYNILKKYLTQGYTLEELSEEYNMSVTSIRKILSDLGYKPYGKHIEEEVIKDKISLLYFEKRFTTEEISFILGLKVEEVDKIIRKITSEKLSNNKTVKTMNKNIKEIDDSVNDIIEELSTEWCRKDFLLRELHSIKSNLITMSTAINNREY